MLYDTILIHRSYYFAIYKEFRKKDQRKATLNFKFKCCRNSIFCKRKIKISPQTIFVMSLQVIQNILTVYNFYT